MDNARTESGPGGKYNDPSTGQPYTHAAGGVTTGPVGGGGGEAGPEVIIPLSSDALTASLTQAFNRTFANEDLRASVKALQAAMEDVIATGERLDAELRELKKNVNL